MPPGDANGSPMFGGSGSPDFGVVSGSRVGLISGSPAFGDSRSPDFARGLESRFVLRLASYSG